MRCDQATLSRYLDGDLTLPARRDLEHHLAGCDACRRDLAELRMVDELLGEWGSIQLPVSSVSDREVLSAVERRRRLAPLFALSRVTPAAVGSCIAAVLVFMTFNLAGIHQDRFAHPPGSQSATVQTIIQKQSAPLLNARRGSAIAGARSVPAAAPRVKHRTSGIIVN